MGEPLKAVWRRSRMAVMPAPVPVPVCSLKASSDSPTMSCRPTPSTSKDGSESQDAFTQGTDGDSDRTSTLVRASATGRASANREALGLRMITGLRLSRRDSEVTVAGGDDVGSKTGSVASSTDVAAQSFRDHHPQISFGWQGVYVLILVSLGALSVYALPPRLAYELDESEQRAADLVQLVATAAFVALYCAGAHHLARAQALKDAHDRHVADGQYSSAQRQWQHSEREGLRAAIAGALQRGWCDGDAGWEMETLHHPFNVLLQVALAEVLPATCDIIAMAAGGSLAQPLRLVGVLRLLHLVHMNTAFRCLGRNFTMPFLACFMYRSLLTLSCNIHYVACLFWARGPVEDAHPALACSRFSQAAMLYMYLRWRGRPPHQPTVLARRDNFSPRTWVGMHAPWLLDERPATQYLHSLYFATVTASTVGYGDLSPVSEPEVVLAIVFMFINIVISANIVGGISALTSLSETNLAQHRNHIASFERMLKRDRISEDIAAATRAYLKLQLNEHEANVDELPPAVRIRIREERWSDALKVLPLLSGLPASFISACAARVKPNAFVSGMQVCRAGDSNMRLCIILEGHATLQLPTVMNDDGNVSSNPTVAIFRAGSCFGAEAFVCDLPQPWHVKAVSLLRVIALDETDRCELMAAYPAEWTQLRRNLTQGLGTIKQAAKKMASQLSEQGDKPGHRKHARWPSLSRVKLHSLRMWLPLAEATNATAQEALSDAARSAEERAVRTSARASLENAGRICDLAAKGDSVELERLLGFLSLEDIPGDYDGREALHLAAAGGHNEVVSLLVSRGASISPVDRFGRTPLTEAVLNGKDATIALLVSHGAQLQLSDQETASLLCDAASKGDTILVRRYLAAGANSSAADYDRRTGLMLAAAEGQQLICRALLDARADPTATDRWGHSAAMEAESHGHVGPLLELLRDAEATWQP